MRKTTHSHIRRHSWPIKQSPKKACQKTKRFRLFVRSPNGPSSRCCSSLVSWPLIGSLADKNCKARLFERRRMGEIIWLEWPWVPFLGFSLRWLDWRWQSSLGLFCIRTRIRNLYQEKITRKFVRRARPAEARLNCKVFIRVFANLLLCEIQILRFESTKENLAWQIRSRIVKKLLKRESSKSIGRPFCGVALDWRCLPFTGW